MAARQAFRKWTSQNSESCPTAAEIEVNMLHMNNSCVLDATNMAEQDVLCDKQDPSFVSKQKPLHN